MSLLRTILLHHRDIAPVRCIVCRGEVPKRYAANKAGHWVCRYCSGEYRRLSESEWNLPDVQAAPADRASEDG